MILADEKKQKMHTMSVSEIKDVLIPLLKDEELDSALRWSDLMMEHYGEVGVALLVEMRARGLRRREGWKR